MQPKNTFLMELLGEKLKNIEEANDELIDFKEALIFALLGLFINNGNGLTGTIYLMLGHGLISSALFTCVGFLYDRYHTRLLAYYND